MDSEQMKRFERCKEERLFYEGHPDMFIGLLNSVVSIDFDFFSNRNFFLGFLSYLLASQLK